MNRLPGLFLTAVITIIAYAISYLPFSPFTLMHNGIAIHPLEPMVIALILGIIAGNTLFISKFANGMKKTNLMGIISSSHIKAKLASGINFSIKVLLPLGIVLMGVKFDLLAVIKLSAQALVINLICIVLAYILTNLICQFLKIDSQMRALITIGTAICGGSAIVALAPVIKANQTQTAIAMTIVSLYGLIAIFIFPLLGQLLGLSQLQFGIWAGTSIQAVPQVIAAGFAVGALAGQVATVVKMVRILLLAPMVVFIGMRHHKDQSKEHQIGKKWRTFFPTFILYFLLMVILNTLGFFDYLDQITHLAIKEFLLLLSAFFMAMAMVGVGLNTDLKTLFKSGGKPLLAGGIAMVILSSVAAVLVLFID